MLKICLRGVAAVQQTLNQSIHRMPPVDTINYLWQNLFKAYVLKAPVTVELTAPTEHAIIANISINSVVLSFVLL